MILEKEYAPQYREADDDGKIGIKGYLSYFQDMAGEFMYKIGKGNDSLRKEYKTFWMYTKYKMHVEKKAGFEKCLHMETWVEKNKHSAVLNQALVISRDGEVYAHGVLESCFFNMEKNRLVRPDFVGFDERCKEEKGTILSFERFHHSIHSMEPCYNYIVRYTDLDGNHHMTNLHYINLMIDCCDSEFYKKYKITDFEIHFLEQSYEKDELKIYKKTEGNKIYIAIVSKEDQMIAQGIMTVMGK